MELGQRELEERVDIYSEEDRSMYERCREYRLRLLNRTSNGVLLAGTVAGGAAYFLDYFLGNPVLYISAASMLLLGAVAKYTARQVKNQTIEQ